MTQLIEAAELVGLLGDPALRLLDCRFDLAAPAAGRQAWQDGRIPGAVYAHLDEDLAAAVTEDSGRHPLPEREDFVAWLGRAGIAADCRIVVYDAASSAVAARAWWMLRWAGAACVQVLNGGYQAWLSAGGPVETDVPPVTPCEFLPGPTAGELVTADDILRRTDARRLLLVDARDAARFRGDVEPLDAVAGHIPGSCNLPFADQLDASGRFRSPEALRSAWSAVLETAPGVDAVAVSCGSGVTACHLVLGALLAGLPEPALYAGSWSEWIRDPDRPVERGIPALPGP